MSNDRRSKRAIFVAHCRLNQNAISDGSLGAVRPVVENTRIRRAIRRHPAALRMEELVRQVVHQISEHRRNGFDAAGPGAAGYSAGSRVGGLLEGGGYGDSETETF